MATWGQPAYAGTLGQIESRVMPGEGVTLYLRGVIDVRIAGELEQKLGAAHRSHPPVTVDLTKAQSLDSAVVDILASASSAYPEGLRVVGASAGRPVSFEASHVEHLLDR